MPLSGHGSFLRIRRSASGADNDDVLRCSQELRTAGLTVLRGPGLALCQSEVELLRDAVMDRISWTLERLPPGEIDFAECCARSSLRWDLKVPALKSPNFAFLQSGSALHDVLEQSFRTPSFRLMHCGALIAWPSDTGVLRCDDLGNQIWHRDENNDAGLAERWSPFGVSAYVPLVDITSSNGLTEFLPDSQLDFLPQGVLMALSETLGMWPPRAPWSTEGLKAGDVVLFDVRLVHRGMLNSSAADGHGPYGVRPVMQLNFGVDAWNTMTVNFSRRSLNGAP